MPLPCACNMLEIVSDFTPWFWKVCMPHVFDYQMFNIQKPDQPRIEVLGISVLGYGILDSLILSCSQVGTRISQTFGSPWQSNSSTGGGSKAEGDDSLCIFYCNPVYPYKGSFCHGNMLRIQPPLATLFCWSPLKWFSDVSWCQSQDEGDLCPTFTDNGLEYSSAGCYAGRRLGKFEVHQEETKKMTRVEKICFTD